MTTIAIDRDEVHVWHVDQSAIVHDLDRYAGLLNQAERNRADRFRFEKDRVESILSRGVLRSLLERYGVAPAAEVRFALGPRGKPEPSPDHRWDGLTFNVSHSHGRTVVALARDRPIGVDVERLRDSKDADGLVNRFFAEEERAEYRSLAPDDRSRGFYRGWTRKEAFVKATGVGLGYPLGSFAVTLGPVEPPRLIRLDGDPLRGAGWTIADRTIDPDHVVALAIEATGLRIKDFAWPADARPPGSR